MISTFHWVVLASTLLHSTTALPLEPQQRSEWLEEITDMKSEVKELFEQVKELSKPSNVDDNQRQTQDDPNRICVSKECVAASHQLFQNMDVSINPCEDFYQYSCGNFIKQSTIPDDKKMLSSSFSPLRDRSK